MKKRSTAAARNRPWNTPWNTQESEHARRKPDGGFCFIPAMALLRAWWAYQRKIIRLYDLRVWFACFEAVARRCIVGPNRFFRYTMEEIHLLVGGSDCANIQTAVRRLSNAGLLDWSERQIRFPVVPREVGDDSHGEWERMVGLVVNHRRKVPVPRRTLRFLAGLSRPVAIATVLGHLLRCLYYRSGLCEPCGRCKASWIADVFGVDVRNVKAARLHLSEIGWLVVQESHQTAMNRWGAAVIIQLDWSLGRSPPSGKPPPPPADSPAGSPPPRKDRELSSRTDHTKPASAARTGARALPPPSLHHVRVEDLGDPRRLEVLFDEARRRRVVPAGEAARLRFHAAGAHAVRLGVRNPAGLFATIVRQGLWSFLSAVDEDQARRRLANVSRNSRPDRFRKAERSASGAAPTPARTILAAVLPTLRMATVSVA